MFSNFVLLDSLGMRILLAFSIYTNTKKWANTKSGKDNIACMHGIRFFSTCWVILGHTFSTFSGQFGITNILDLSLVIFYSKLYKRIMPINQLKNLIKPRTILMHTCLHLDL